MLIYYRFNNFCSFHCESEFSMIAPIGKVKKRFPDNYVETLEGYDLLKSVVIIGENAGGKSNFIHSLAYLKSLFINNSVVKSFRPFINVLSLQSEKSPIQKFELCFRAKNKKIYIYELQMNESGIVLEKLQVVKKKKSSPVCIFEVIRMENGRWQIVTQDTKSLTIDLNQSILGNMGNNGRNIGLIVSKYALLGNADALAVVEWMTTILCPQTLITNVPENIVKQEEDISILEDKRYLNIFRMVDYSICGIELDYDKPYSRTMIVRKDEKGNIFKRELQMDSTGVREFFAWAVQIFRVVYEDKVIFADEMDRVLNPILSDRVIAFINGAEHYGQFIFSTHNVLHLDLKTYMKEQIYFITKDRENLTSELYSLADFPEVRYETTKIYEFYMRGILGGTAFE